MDTVRIARDLGDMSLLMPPGITHLLDLPWNIWDAIRNALAFLGFDEMDKDERPPRKIWMEYDLLDEHMKAVDKARRVKYGGEKADRFADEPMDGPTEQNALVAEIFG